MDDSILTNVDDTPNKSFYGLVIPRTKESLKKDGVIVDTNSLAWLDTVRESNAKSDSKWF